MGLDIRPRQLEFLIRDFQEKDRKMEATSTSDPQGCRPYTKEAKRNNTSELSGTQGQ